MANVSIAPSVNNDSVRIDFTTTPLADSSTYTSPNNYRVANFDRITGTCFSDQNGSLVISQSSDGSNFDYSTTTAVTANTGVGFSIEIIAPWVKIQFTNSGGAAQTAFRLYTFVRAI